MRKRNRTLMLVLMACWMAPPASAQTTPRSPLDLERLIPRGPQYVYGDDERVKISVNVWGEVERPGSYLIPDDTDLITLLSLAGGPTGMADLGGVKLVRFHAEHPATSSLDLDRMLASPQTPPPGLLPGDTIQVPRRRSLSWGGLLRGVYELALVASTIVLVTDRVRE